MRNFFEFLYKFKLKFKHKFNMYNLLSVDADTLFVAFFGEIKAAIAKL